MYSQKSVKSLQLILNRQKCLNWCQIVVNRRYLSDDKENKTTIDTTDGKIDSNNSKESEDTVEGNARQHLNQLIGTLKNDSEFGKFDDKLRRLLAKPITHIRKSARKEIDLSGGEENINEISAKLDDRLVLAAKGIANTLSGEEAKTTENDLLKLLKLQIIETNLAKEGKELSKKDLSLMLGGFRVVKEEKTSLEEIIHRRKPTFEKKTEQRREATPRRPEERIDEIQEVMFRPSEKRFVRRKKEEPSEEPEKFIDRRKLRQSTITDSLLARERAQSREKVDLFRGEDLGIFDANMKETTDSSKLYIWDRLLNEELQNAIARPPRNGFEEMIKWTEEGKLWKYPINNEQGLEEEEKVPFYEHVLLDHLLEGFPETGPVRKFMELVIMGLSSNPYITVERKHATVDYYRSYFADKHEMLQIAGALG